MKKLLEALNQGSYNQSEIHFHVYSKSPNNIASLSQCEFSRNNSVMSFTVEVMLYFLTLYM